MFNKNKALINACRRNDVEKMKRLLEKGADINAVEDADFERCNPLLASIRWHKRDAAMYLLEQPGIKIGRANVSDSANVPLVRAVINGMDEVFDRLLALGAFHDETTRGGETALMIAALNNRMNMLQTLLGLGGDISRQCKNGRSALHYATVNGHKDIVSVLMAAGVDATLRDAENKRAIDYAASTDLRSLLRAHEKQSKSMEPADPALVSMTRPMANGWRMEDVYDFAEKVRLRSVMDDKNAPVGTTVKEAFSDISETGHLAMAFNRYRAQGGDRAREDFIAQKQVTPLRLDTPKRNADA